MRRGEERDPDVSAWRRVVLPEERGPTTRKAQGPEDEEADAEGLPTPRDGADEEEDENRSRAGARSSTMRAGRRNVAENSPIWKESRAKASTEARARTIGGGNREINASIAVIVKVSELPGVVGGGEAEGVYGGHWGRGLEEPASYGGGFASARASAR